LSVLLATVLAMGFHERVMRSGGVATVSGWQVKQYRLTVTDEQIEPAVLDAASAFLPALLPAPDAADTTPRVAFAVLHKGMNAVWCNLYAWCLEAIVHCRLGSAPLSAPTDFAPVSQPLIGCVWELPALAHERSAWVRHMLAGPSPDLDGYLDDWLADGPIGRP
jgi:hypothetical protein